VLVKNRADALLARFPGPLTIGLSVTKHVLLLTIAGVFIAAGVDFIRSPEVFAAPSPKDGIFRVLVWLHVACDMREAVAEFGWFVLVFFGASGLTITLKLVLGITGRCGLTLDREGFVVKSLRRSNFHRWIDVDQIKDVRELCPLLQRT
jgi:hypothetical protein